MLHSWALSKAVGSLLPLRETEEIKMSGERRKVYGLK